MLYSIDSVSSKGDLYSIPTYKSNYCHHDKYFHSFLKRMNNNIYTNLNKTFLEFGAYDGITSSNSYFLEEIGWRGVCVEPNPKSYKNLLKSNRKCIKINAGIGDKDGFKIFVQTKFKQLSGFIEYMSKEHVEMLNENKIEQLYLIPIMKIETLLNKLSINKFDYISLDCEGCELSFLKNGGLNSFYFLNIELNDNEKIKNEEIKGILKNHDEINLDCHTDKFYYKKLYK